MGFRCRGVTIILKGSSTGTATDASGKFKMHFIDENETVTWCSLLSE